MAKRKRVTPSVDEVGKPQRSQPSSIPRYNIVGDAGLPIGPNPLEQLSSALGSFNKGFQVAGAAHVAKQRQKAVEMLPELEGYVTDQAIEISKAWEKNKLNPAFNPVVVSTAYSLIGERTAKKDVDTILDSEDFQGWAQGEIDQEGDFGNKLQQYVLHHLPNRNNDDKTKSAYWKRGYDPAVLGQLDKKLPSWTSRQKEHKLFQVREANVLKAQESLSEAISSNDTKGFQGLMGEMYVFYPRDAAKGVRFNSEMLNKVVMPVFTAALDDPDTDLDQLEDTFESIMAMRRYTKKGSTVMFGGQAEVGRNWFSQRFEAERLQGSKAWQKEQADYKVVGQQFTQLVKGWSTFMADNPAIGQAGIKTPNDITVGNFDTVVDHIVKGDYITFDESRFENITRGGRAALIRDMQTMFTTAWNKKISDEEDLSLNQNVFKKRLIKGHPQWQALVEKIDISKYLRQGTLNSGSYLTDLMKDVDEAQIATDSGLKNEVVGIMLSRMLVEHVDSGAKAQAQRMVSWFRGVHGKKVIAPQEIEALRNLVDSIYTDDHDVKPALDEILTSIEKDTNISPYVDKFKFKDTLYDLASLSHPGAGKTGASPISVMQEMTKYYNTKMSTLEGRAERDWDEDENLVGIKASAAQTVIMRAESDYNELLAERLRLWEQEETDLSISFPKTKAEIENSVREQMRKRIPEYEQDYKGLVADTKKEDAGNRSAAVTGFFPEEVAQLDVQYMANMKEINALSSKGLVTYGALRDNKKMGTGMSFATNFFADAAMHSGDTRFGKLDRIQKQASVLTERFKTNLSGLYEKQRKDSEASLLNPNKDRTDAISAEVESAESQLKAHVIRYEGVSWRDIHNKTAGVKFMAGGKEVNLPITHRDINFASSVLHESWEDLDRIEALFDHYETEFRRAEALAAGEEWDGKKLSFAQSEEAKKEVEEYIDFVRKVTDIDLLPSGSPDLDEGNQRKHREWAAQQRLQMIATDPSKLPEKMNLLIKRQALKNFYNTGRWQGKPYVQEDIDRVKAAQEYNDFIAKGDFSMKTGITHREFLTLYRGITGGRMYKEMHHLRGGAARGKGGMSWSKEPVPDRAVGNTEAQLTKEQMNVIAQELATASVGYTNATGARVTHPGGGTHHPYNTMRTQYMGEFNRLRKLLETSKTGRSPELATAFQKLHDSQNPMREYTHEDTDSVVTSYFPTEWNYLNPMYLPNLFHWMKTPEDENVGGPVRGLLSSDPVGGRRWAEESGEMNLLAPFNISLKKLPTK